MVGSMLHPLNKTVIDHERKCVISGCGIMQPRVSVELKSANATLFHGYSQGRGTDPYSSSSGDIYRTCFQVHFYRQGHYRRLRDALMP